MLRTYIPPRIKGDLVQINFIHVQDGPVYNHHHEGEGRDGGVKEAMQSAHEARQPVKDHRTPRSCVAERVDGRDEEVEPVAPERDPGEEAE